MRTEFIAPRVSYTRTVNNNRERAEFWGLAGSASLDGKQLTLTAVNPDAKMRAKRKSMSSARASPPRRRAC